MSKIYLDGKLLSQRKHEEGSLQPTSGYERGLSHTTKRGDIEASLNELNKDEIDPKTKMTTLDLRSRLHALQIEGMSKWDSVIAFNFLPVMALFVTRTMKRLMVSLDGKGREEMVNITRQNLDKQATGGFGTRLWEAFFPKKQE